MKKLSVFLVLLLITHCLFAEVEFQLPSFGQEDDLVFTVKTDVPGMGKSSTLFSVKIEDYENKFTKKIKQLSVFPEESVLINDNKAIQIRNRFGIFRTAGNYEKLERIETYSSFIDGEQIINGKLYPLYSSPDGAFFVYIKPDSYGYGSLILFDCVTGIEIKISENVELSYSQNIVLWSPDSSLFIYSKDDCLFYYSVEKFYQQKFLSDEFRKIGEGSIRNVRWSANNLLYYINGSVIYKVISEELFTGSLYGNIVQPGEVVGKIPFLFNPIRDSFYISPAENKIIYNKDETNLFIFPLSTKESSFTKEDSIQYLYLSENIRLKKLVWSMDDILTLLTSGMKDGKKLTSIYRINLNNEDETAKIKKLSEEGVVDIELSENSKTIAFLYTDRVELKDYKLMKTVVDFSFTEPLKFFWIDTDNFLIVGKYTIEVYNNKTKAFRIISLSQAESAGFTKNGEIFAINNDEKYILEKDNIWRIVSVLDSIPSKPVSENLRSSLQTLPNGPYKNMIILRRLDRVGTEPLFSCHETKYEALPDNQEEIDLVNFTHGSRIRSREVAIVFNAVNQSNGLSDVLRILNDYGIKSTFFLNGDFMQRNPEAVKMLASSEHEIGSLFFTYFNMTDANYRMDKDFIKKGLAKNEDDYFALTGKELSLLWHAPYYAVNTEIIDFSAEMNYHYINRDVYTLEWLKDKPAFKKVLDPNNMIEKIMESKKPGSIIPIMIGGRPDESSLCNKLDLLINNLIKDGYKIVPVSVLLDKANLIE